MDRMDRLKVGVLFGGSSEEHPISVKSAQEVARNLDLEKYEPFFIGITKSGAWRLCDGPYAHWENGTSHPAVLSPDRSVHGLLVLDQGRYESIRLDVVLPVLHGKLGEDGALQGLLELSGIPYVGCDVQSSALCMDKSLAYIVAASAGIATPTYWTLAANEKADPDAFAYPVFVKPARSGSSFGVSKVSEGDELLAAVQAARRYDSKVLIEEAVVGSEVGCAILGERFGLVAGEVDHIALSHGFFRIHQEDEPETGSENATAIVPADISPRERDARSGDRKGDLSRPGLQGSGASGHVPHRRRNGRTQRGQHAAGHDLLQPLPAHDGGGRAAASRGDRPAYIADIARETAMKNDFVFVDEFVPGIRWDAKYSTWDNFTGKPVDGYQANRIVGTRAMCVALERVRERAASLGYRPARLGWLPASTRGGLLRALVEGARGRPDEAAALSEHRTARHVQKGLRSNEIRPQQGKHRRPHALSPVHRRTGGHGR